MMTASRQATRELPQRCCSRFRSVVALNCKARRLSSGWDDLNKVEAGKMGGRVSSM